MKLPDESGCVVTGAASGLGRALARELARRGGRVVVSDIDLEGAEATVEELRRGGAQAWAIRCDVREYEEVEALEARARELLGEVDFVANNAGVAAGGYVGDIPLDDWRWAIDINLWGVIHGCRAFLPAMKDRNRGWILNVASAAGFVCLPQFAPYNVSKAGVIALTETMRAELADHDVSVSVLCPSFFATRIADSSRGDDDNILDLSRRLMSASKLSADDVAKHALTSLERGRLYGLPMNHARAIWWAKRTAPQAFHGVVGFARQQLDRWENWS